MSDPAIPADPAARLAQQQANAAAEMANLQRLTEVQQKTQEIRGVHFDVSLAPKLNLPPEAQAIARGLFVQGEDSQLAKLQLAPVARDQKISFLGPNGQPSYFEVDVNHPAAYTLQPTSAESDAPTLADLRGMLDEQDAYSRSVRAAGPGDPGFVEDGIGIAPDGTAEPRHAPISDEHWRDRALKAMPSLLPPLSPDEAQLVTETLTNHWGNAAALAQVAIVRRVVEGPEGEPVATYAVQQWAPGAPYPTSDPSCEVTTLRKLAEIGKERAAATLQYGDSIAAAAVRPIHHKDLIAQGGPEFTRLA